MVPTVERLNHGIPLLQKIIDHPWENKVTFNPACVLVDDKEELQELVEGLPFDQAVKRILEVQPALCFVLYRAQGKPTPEYDFSRSCLGVAIFSPDLQLIARYDKPVVLPNSEYDDLGVEDPRITKIDGRYIMLYTAYSRGRPSNNIRIALASTTDFLHWKKHGLLRGGFNTLNNKNAMLFPQKINHRYVLLHRPMSGVNAMSIHWATSEEIFGDWKTHGVLMEPIHNPLFADTWIGGGAPPLQLQDGRYLIIYHIGNRKQDGNREYDLGIAVCEANEILHIVRRNEPLIRPEAPPETIGDADLGVNNVVFICGAYFYDRELYFPYAGADSVILGGKISYDDLQRYLNT